MPALSQTATALLRYRAVTMTTAAAHAQDAARRLRAKSEQHMIDTECHLTKLTLTQDKQAWHAYRRQQGKSAEDYIPYLT